MGSSTFGSWVDFGGDGTYFSPAVKACCQLRDRSGPQLVAMGHGIEVHPMEATGFLCYWHVHGNYESSIFEAHVG